MKFSLFNHQLCVFDFTFFFFISTSIGYFYFLLSFLTKKYVIYIFFSYICYKKSVILYVYCAYSYYVALLNVDFFLTSYFQFWKWGMRFLFHNLYTKLESIRLEYPCLKVRVIWMSFILRHWQIWFAPRSLCFALYLFI